MSVSAYHTTEVEHVYERLYVVMYGHYEKPGGGFDFSHRGVRGWMCKQCNYHWISNENEQLRKVANTKNWPTNSKLSIPFPILLVDSFNKFYQPKIQRLCRHVNNVLISRLWTLTRSMWNPSSSFTASLFGLAFCHCAKILKVHFVTYRGDFKTNLHVRRLQA